MKKNYNIATIIWDIVYPVLIYYVTLVIAMYVARLFIGAGEEKYMLCQIVAALVTIPVIYFNFYKKDWWLTKSVASEKINNTEITGKNGSSSRKIVLLGAIICIATALIGFSLNNLICMTPLVENSKGFEKANESFFAAPLIFQVIGSGIIVPILEEMVYRGIVFKRLMRIIDVKAAIILSSLFFGLMHFNIVQFVYAFLLGIVLAFYIQETGSIYSCMLGHMTANTIAVFRTYYGLWKSTSEKTISAFFISVVALIIGSALLYCFYRINSVKELKDK